MDHKAQSKQDTITVILIEEGIIHFSGNLSIGNDLAINFVKCKTKNKYT